MVVALSSTAATLGLVGIFFVLFPVLVQGLLAFAVVQVVGEKKENDAYAASHRVPGTPRTQVD
jgi:hypothetical protein